MTRSIHRRDAGFSRWDLLVLGALILLLPAFLIPSLCRSTETANRVKCASNLRQIGQAILLYANDNKGQYPKTIAGEGADVTPVWGTGAEAPDPFGAGGPSPNDVSASLFLLMRTQDITPEVFTCPSSNAEKWDFGGGDKNALNWSNWPKKTILNNLSYSFHNSFSDDWAAETHRPKGVVWRAPDLRSDFAVAADLNPGVIPGKADVLNISSTSSAKNMKLGNSANHDQDGQNVLYEDGHVEFQQNPFVGVNRDNIFARRAASTGFASAPLPIARSPYDVDDTVLLPCAE